MFYRHSSTDEGVHFIFPGSLVRSGEKPVTTMKPEPLEAPPPKRSKVRGMLLARYNLLSH